MSHLGRPDVDPIPDKYSLESVAVELKSLLGKHVCSWEQSGESLNWPSCWICHPAREHFFSCGGRREGKGCIWEQGYSPASLTRSLWAAFAKQGCSYVKDAFGTDHGAHSSMVGVRLETFLCEDGAELLWRGLEEPSLVMLGGVTVTD